MYDLGLERGGSSSLDVVLGVELDRSAMNFTNFLLIARMIRVLSCWKSGSWLEEVTAKSEGPRSESGGEGETK